MMPPKSNRCEECAVNWPAHPFCEHCPRCGFRTELVAQLPNHSLAFAKEAEAKRTGAAWKLGDDDRRVDEDRPEELDTSTARGSRVAAYLRLGFDTVQAELLADARSRETTIGKGGRVLGWDLPLYWGRVAEALAAGCTRDQAVMIYA